MRIFLAILICTFTLSSLAQGGGTARVAYIDMEYILRHSPEYDEASSQLANRANQWKEEINKKKENIKKLKDELAAERILLTRNLIEEKEEEIASLENELYEYQQKQFGTEGNYITQKVILAKPIQDQVFSIVQEIAEARKFDYVLDKNSESTMLIAAKRYDISDLVIRRMTTARRKQYMTPEQVEAVEKGEKEQDAIALRQSKRDDQKREKEEAVKQIKEDAKQQQLASEETKTVDNAIEKENTQEVAKRQREEQLRELEERKQRIEQEKQEKIEEQKELLRQKQEEIAEKKRQDEENRIRIQEEKQREIERKKEEIQQQKAEKEKKLEE
jgi:Skp family chaperone for outer membrane proteins